MNLRLPEEKGWEEGYITTLGFTYTQCCCCCLVAKSRLTLLRPHGLKPARLLCPWNFPGKNSGVDSHFLLQWIFLTQGLNPYLLSKRHLLHCRRILIAEILGKPDIYTLLQIYNIYIGYIVYRKTSISALLTMPKPLNVWITINCGKF